MRLRNLLPKDAPHMLSWMHDDSINRFFTVDFKCFEEKNALDFIEAAQADPHHVHLACVDEDDTYLGTVSLKNINHTHKNAEYAICMCKHAHGTGAAKFATDEIIRIAFMDKGLERVYLSVLAKNIRANAFYQKQGFTFEGTFQKHVYLNGEFCDLNWYGVMKEQFFKKD